MICYIRFPPTIGLGQSRRQSFPAPHFPFIETGLAGDHAFHRESASLLSVALTTARARPACLPPPSAGYDEGDGRGDGGDGDDGSGRARESGDDGRDRHDGSDGGGQRLGNGGIGDDGSDGGR